MTAALKFTPEELEEQWALYNRIKNQLNVELRKEKIALARRQLIPFAELMMPDPTDPMNPELSRYQAAKHHRAIAAALEEVEKGNWLRLIIDCPPRHGKSQLATRFLPPWFIGRDPYRNIIVATYGDDFAEDFGREVREYMQSDVYREIFPNVQLAYGSRAADRLKTSAGGNLFFVGRKGRTTGRGADLILIDDPIKDDEEARSPTVRDKVWNWFLRTVSTRLMTVSGRIVIIMTRWHEDDPVGRLTDPNNPYYNAKEAAKWRIVHLPALAEEDDPLGRKPGEALWPERFTREYLEAMRSLDPVGFSALYQGRPTPEQGDFFKAEYIRTYQPRELPQNLRYYAASDHAVGDKQRHDFTVLLVVGVDEQDQIWLIDCWWNRAQTDVVAEAMIDFMQKYPIQMWWAESGHISKSIGPFLRKRMKERKVFCAIDEQPANVDKRVRAQSIQGRMAMGMVLFPRFAPWFAKAKSELLSFDGGTHDDFVDALSHIGMGLSKQFKAKKPKPRSQEAPIGTLAWVKQASEAERRRKILVMSSGGF